ncbi:phosphoenolpyruvate--protein phosphotransferase [Candidatus Sumerlaeota bacterium]|nr:phosphoenolpyruvate--protein phosphotransferase [Candidatus Sumerlaeota bacterium]
MKSPHRVLHGIPASPGASRGVVFLHGVVKTPVKRYSIPESRVESEIDRFNQAVEKAREQLRQTHQMVGAKIDKVHASIFEAQEVLLDDPLLVDACRRDIRADRLNAEFVLERNVEQIRQLFEQIEVPHLQLQNLDVLDVAARIRENLTPQKRSRIEDVGRNSVIIAHDLLPSDTARLNRRHVAGIVTEVGGPTSHSAILAKALNIPAVVGVEGIVKRAIQSAPILIDGYTGTVTLSPTKHDEERFRQRQEALKADRESLHKLRDLPCETRDGYAIDLAANLEFPSEVAGVKTSGARGIGLFRTEFFYIDRGYIPSEEEQFQVYKEVLEHIHPMPVVFRTLDIGGDKFISQSGVVSNEINPFLGLRAIRLCLANPDMFRAQLRAMLRASAFGNTRIMIPFVTDVSEVRRSVALIEEIKRDLRRVGIEHDENVQVGIMIETPSAALTADVLAREVDFFSIGTNDLIQYTMAVDRVNESVADLYNPLHPSVVRLIRDTIDAAHKNGLWVGLCGEMAADPVLAVFLMGLGIDELSMSAVAIPWVKRLIRSLTLEDVRKLRQDILETLRLGQAGAVVKRFRRKHLRPLSDRPPTGR